MCSLLFETLFSPAATFTAAYTRSRACRYDPRKHACWRAGPVPYEHVATTFTALDSTTKRLRIGDALTNMFVAVMVLHPADLEATAYLTVGKIAPEYEGKEMQVGGSTVSHAISDATGA